MTENGIKLIIGAYLEGYKSRNETNPYFAAVNLQMAYQLGQQTHLNEVLNENNYRSFKGKHPRAACKAVESQSVYSLSRTENRIGLQGNTLYASKG